MTLNVALRIEGDVSKAKAALDQAARAVADLQRKVQASSGAAAQNNAAAAAAERAHGRAAAAANVHAASVANLNRNMAVARQTAALLVSQLGAGGFGSVAAGAIAANFGPQGLIVLGLTAATAAAAAFFSKVGSDASAVEPALKEHERIVSAIRSAYSGAAGEAARFGRETRAILELQTRLNILNLETQLRDLAPGIAQRALGPGPSQRRFYEVFDEARQRLQESIQAGRPDMLAFLDEVAKIGAEAAKAGDFGLAKLANHLLNTAKEAGDAAFGLAQAERALRVLTGTASQDDFRSLGIQLRGTTGEYERLVAQMQKRAEGLRIEAETAGMSAAAAARYRAEQELINAAARDGIALTEAQTLQNRTLADAIGQAAARLEGLRIMEELRPPLESYNREIERLNELLRQGAIDWETYEHAAARANYNAFVASQQALAGEMQMRQQVAQQAIGLLTAIGTRSKAAAVAAIALNKALMIAQTVQNTAAASMRALAELGPIAGPPVAASIQALGAAQVALIGATGLVEGADALKGSSAPALPGGAAPAAAPQPAVPAAAAQQNITIVLQGRSYSDEDIRELFDRFNEAMRDGAKLNLKVI